MIFVALLPFGLLTQSQHAHYSVQNCEHGTHLPLLSYCILVCSKLQTFLISFAMRLLAMITRMRNEFNTYSTTWQHNDMIMLHAIIIIVRSYSFRFFLAQLVLYTNRFSFLLLFFFVKVFIFMTHNVSTLSLPFQILVNAKIFKVFVCLNESRSS